jgi:hypothetical protein
MSKERVKKIPRLKDSDQDHLEKLRSQLAISATLYASDVLDQQRKAVIGAIFAVQDYLEAQGFPPETLRPLLRPAFALMERENNNLDQMFAQRARGGRPAATMEQHERTGILAAFANAWLRVHQADGIPQTSKLAEAARRLRGGWFGEVTRSNLKTARDIVSQEASNHPAVVIARLFDQLFEEAFALDGPVNAFELMRDYVNVAPASRIKGICKTPTVSSPTKG